MLTLKIVLTSSALFWGLLILFVILNILDGHSTFSVLRPHHYHRERNPIARWVFQKLQIPRGIVIFKAILLGILIPAMAFYAYSDPLTINIVLITSNFVFLLVVIHNYRVARRIRGSRNR